MDEELAIRDGAPQLHGNVPSNITTHYKVGGGDFAEAARKADQILRLRLVNNRLIPTCLETRCVLAEPNADGTLTVYMPSQVPHMHRRWIAETVGIPEHRLRIVAADIGGGFGTKMHLYPEELPMACWSRPSRLPRLRKRWGWCGARARSASSACLVVMRRITLRGSIVGGREDLAVAIAFAAQGKVRAEIQKSKLENINQIFADLKAGTVDGRVVIMM